MNHFCNWAPIPTALRPHNAQVKARSVVCDLSVIQASLEAREREPTIRRGMKGRKKKEDRRQNQ